MEHDFSAAHGSLHPRAADGRRARHRHRRGAGVFTREMARHAGEVVCVDLNPAPPNNRFGANVTVLQDDGFKAAAEHGPFDIAFALHVIEHVDDPLTDLRSLRDHCSRLAIEVPDVSSVPLNNLRRKEGLPFYSAADHVSEFTAESLGILIENAGWQDVQLQQVNGMLLAVANAQ